MIKAHLAGCASVSITKTNFPVLELEYYRLNEDLFFLLLAFHLQFDFDKTMKKLLNSFVSAV